MRHPAPKHRFSAWDGSQSLPLDPDQILEALADDLMEYGDLRWAMRNLMSRGMQIPQGGYMQGLRDMLKRLRDQKRQRLEQYDLSSIFDDFRDKLDEILGMERDRIDEWKNKPSDDFSSDVLKKVAERNEQTLDDLPDDVAGKVKELEKYEFLNPDAQK